MSHVSFSTTFDYRIIVISMCAYQELDQIAEQSRRSSNSSRVLVSVMSYLLICINLCCSVTTTSSLITVGLDFFSLFKIQSCSLKEGINDYDDQRRHIKSHHLPIACVVSVHFKIKCLKITIITIWQFLAVFSRIFQICTLPKSNALSHSFFFTFLSIVGIKHFMA